MTEVKTFSNEEIIKISDAKNKLEDLIKSTGIYDHHIYNIQLEKLIKQSVSDNVKSNMVIAGGVISSILNNEQINDIDIFVLNLKIDSFNFLIAEKTGPWFVKYFFDDDNDPRSDDYKNDHVFATATNQQTKVQYILTDYKDRKSLLADFDYLHCTASYHEDKLFINRETYDAINNRMLIPRQRNKKIRQWREQKFVNRGWRTEIDALINEPSKTLNKILQDKLDGIRRVTASTYGSDITLDDLLDDPYAVILKRP